MATQFAFGKIVTNGLVLALDAADRNSYVSGSTIWNDLSGNNNGGTLTNGPTFSNNSIVFDGVDDSVNFSFVNPFAETVIVWARSATSTWNRDGWISSSRRQNGHIIHPVLYSGPSKNVEYYVLDSGTSYTLIGSVTPSDITIPHMYAYTTNGSNLHKGYFDGYEVASSSTSITRTTSPSNQVWYLGQDDTGGRFGNGNIYNCLRYNRALSASEILQNYNAQKSRFNLK
jgi:hypothetical protein